MFGNRPHADYAARFAALTPEQQQAERIARTKNQLARIDRAMQDDINTDAPAYWWERMTKHHIALGMELNKLEGRGAFEYAN